MYSKIAESFECFSVCKPAFQVDIWEVCAPSLKKKEKSLRMSKSPKRDLGFLNLLWWLAESAGGGGGTGWANQWPDTGSSVTYWLPPCLSLFTQNTLKMSTHITLFCSYSYHFLLRTLVK
jgi:hypothetical protein